MHGIAWWEGNEHLPAVLGKRNQMILNLARNLDIPFQKFRNARVSISAERNECNVIYGEEEGGSQQVAE